MRLKILPPAILSLLLLTLTGYAQTLTESPGGQNNGYGIEPGKAYPGTLVLELLETAEAEIDAAVQEAYAEGYKAASLRYAPDAAAYKLLSETMRADLAAEKKKSRYFWPVAGVSAGVSFAAGFLLSSFIGR